LSGKGSTSASWRATPSAQSQKHKAENLTPWNLILETINGELETWNSKP
jgi:hypothetical protein